MSVPYEVLATGSTGNAVVIDGQILVDCGVPYKVVKPVAKALRLVLLTHWHGDHFRKSTLHALAADRPALRFGCCRWMVRPLVEAGVKPANIDLYDFDRRYSYGDFTVEPVPLVHDVPNCGYKLLLPSGKVLYPDEIAQAEAAARAAVDHTEAVNAAVQAERERMQEIDEVASLLDPADVREAKYGEKPCTAADLVMADAKKRAKQGKKFLSDLKDDADESNAEDVGATPPPAEEAEEDDDAKKTPEARLADARAKVSALFGKKEG